MTKERSEEETFGFLVSTSFRKWYVSRYIIGKIAESGIFVVYIQQKFLHWFLAISLTNLSPKVAQQIAAIMFSSRFITNIQALMGYAVAASCYCKEALYRIENVVNYSDKWYYFIFHCQFVDRRRVYFLVFPYITKSIKNSPGSRNISSSGKL